MEGKVLITICTQLVSSPFDLSSGIMRMLGESRVLITHQTRLVRRKLEPQVDLELHRGQRRTQCGDHPQDELVSRHFFSPARPETVVIVGRGKDGGLSPGLVGSQL